MAENIDSDELISSLRQLLRNTEPHIRELNSAEQVSELLIHLEAHDENFHRYEFVRFLRSCIEEKLGGLMEEEMERHSLGPTDSTAGQDLINQITNRVVNSDECKEMLRNLRSQVLESADYFSSNFENEFGSFHTDLYGTDESPQKKEFFSDLESSSLDTSFNQGSLMFLNQEQYQQIAEKLDKRKHLQLRHEALTSLLKIPPGDLQSGETWSQIKRGLRDALADTDEFLSHGSLKFVARGFTTMSNSVRELYTTLVDYLCMEFSTFNSRKLENGLSITHPSTKKLLKGFRLMNEFQCQVPQFWVRYPDRFLDEVLESTLSLLAMQQSSLHITPFHFLSLIDIKACWFIRWMHGNYSRSKLLAALEKHRNIVDCIVKHCLDFCNKRKTSPNFISNIPDSLMRESIGSDQLCVYKSAQLEFAYFVHALHFIGRLLCYTNGRNFFPVKIKVKDESKTVDITALLVTLIQLVTDPYPSKPLQIRAESDEAFEPGQLVIEMLKGLCSRDGVSELCLCRDEVTDALLAPVKLWLSGDQRVSVPDDTTMQQVADILCTFAGSAHGRRHLLYGQKGEQFSHSKSSPAFIISDFIKKAIGGDLTAKFGVTPASSVIIEFLYVCRQMYNTCEGLFVMYPYSLHVAVADAWKQACRDADGAATPTTSPRENEQNILLWEDALRDNLLNFVGTPKGVLLLQLTGAMEECVMYMYKRYTQKLQVSKCEKFGYGFMMSQVAATLPGIQALLGTSFVSDLVKTIWGVLECADDNPVYSPKSWPLLPIDKQSCKLFNTFLNVLSSFRALYEVTSHKLLPNKEEYSLRELPDSVVSLIDRLIVVDTDAKIHSLFNYEQSHVFGLRLLSVLVSCLDTLLFLQTQYRIQDKLLTCQAVNVASEGSTTIFVDMLSVERNSLLVKMFLIGGPSERVIPPRTIMQDKGNPYPFPLFSSYPIPREYSPNIAGRSAMKHENELNKFLSDTKSCDHNSSWLNECRKIFCGILKSKPEQAKGNVLQELMERTLPVIMKNKEEALFPLLDFSGNEATLKSYSLNAMQELGIKMAVRYGVHLKLINSGSVAVEKLTRLLKYAGCYIQQQLPHQHSLRSPDSRYMGMDWFAATIFLLMNGNLDRAWSFLHKFSTQCVSGYLWVPRLYGSVHLPQELMTSNIPPLFYSTCHNVELLLQKEVPHVYSAFKLSGFSPSQICQHWLQQCFWNYLDWLDVCHYVCLCLLLGVDYQVYLCVAVLHFLHTDILQHTQNQDLIVFLKEEPIRGFHVGDHLDFMQNLERKYRSTVLSDMMNLSRP